LGNNGENNKLFTIEGFCKEFLGKYQIETLSM